MSYGDIADGVIYRLEQQLADARSQIAHDARRAREAENRLRAVEKIVDETLRADAEDPEQYPTFNAGYVTAMEDIRDALDGDT